MPPTGELDSRGMIHDCQKYIYLPKCNLSEILIWDGDKNYIP